MHDDVMLSGVFWSLFMVSCWATADTKPIERFITKAKSILGDPGADSGGEGKSKQAGKYGTKKRKERREEPLGTMTYQTSSKRSPPFCLLIGQKNTKVFWHQSEGRTTAKSHSVCDLPWLLRPVLKIPHMK